jgi:hypothetical protein
MSDSRLQGSCRTSARAGLPLHVAPDVRIAIVDWVVLDSGTAYRPAEGSNSGSPRPAQPNIGMRKIGSIMSRSLNRA